MARPALARRTGLPYEQARLPRRSAPRIPPESEEHFQQAVIDFAQALGYLTYHTRDARKSTSGFPDLVLANPARRRLIFMELKLQNGVVSATQREWISALQACGVAAYIFKPCDWEDIVRVLTGVSSG